MKARDVISRLGSLDASAVVASLDRCVIGERETTAVVVAHLVVLERESIHLDMGYSSLFAYCNERLGYSRDCALKRMRAATAATFHPEILDDLESGTLTLSSILPLAPHLTGGQVGTELLEAARGKSRRQIEALVAARFPDRKSPRGDMRIKAVGDGLVRFSMVVGTELIDKLEAARDIDRHRNPEGDVETILSEALARFVAGVEKRKHKVTERPRPAPEAPTKSVPAAVRRAVHQRDGGRCTFEGTERVCGERAFVEHDHVEPRARAASTRRLTAPSCARLTTGARPSFRSAPRRWPGADAGPRPSAICWRRWSDWAFGAPRPASEPWRPSTATAPTQRSRPCVARRSSERQHGDLASLPPRARGRPPVRTRLCRRSISIGCALTDRHRA